jgi:hypothetical protein
METTLMAEQNAALRWWLEKGEARANAVRTTIDRIDNGDGDALQEAHLRHLRLYRNVAMMGFGPYGHIRSNTGLGAPLSLNVCRNMVNTVHSKISKNRPRMTFQTVGANYEYKEKQRLIQGFGDGLFYKGRVYKQTPKTLLDAAVFGSGFLKTFPQKKKDMPILYERTFAPEIRVDAAEGMHGNPRNIYQQKYVDRFRLIAKFPKLEKKIMALVSKHHSDDTSTWGFVPDTRQEDMLQVTEAYHLASEKGADDGLMVISCEDLVLGSRPWPYEFSPFTKMDWTESPIGFWGVGLPEELMGIQVEINRLVRKIQMSFALLSNPYLMVDRGSNVQRGHLSDIPGSIIFYNNKAPQVSAPSVVSSELFSHLDRLYERAYEIAGVSQSQAAGATKSYESGRAQLVDNETSDLRFAAAVRSWENLHEETMYKSLRYIEGEHRNVTVQAMGLDGFKEINYKDEIDLDEDEWIMRIRPTSMLGEDPAGQIDKAERMIKSGLITHPEEILEQMESPDIAEYVRRVTGSKRLVEKQINIMLRGGPQQVPEPQQNLALALEYAVQLYVEAKLDECPPDRLKKVRIFIQNAKREIDSAAAQPAPAPAATGGPQPAAAPPVASSAPMPAEIAA